jgi:hypothetical protein
MNLAAEMLYHMPETVAFDRDQLAACIEACFDCVKACTACADACLGKDMVVEMRRCITTNLGCADICSAMGRILSRQVGDDIEVTLAALDACREVCRRCAEECKQYADTYEHCRICAEACRQCEQACRILLVA